MVGYFELIGKDVINMIVGLITIPSDYYSLPFISKEFREIVRSRKEKDMFRIGRAEKHGWILPNGKRHGIHYVWYSNGHLWAQSEWINGKEHGTSEAWHKNGRPMSLVEWCNGKQHGLHKVWYGDNGNKHSLYKAWYEDDNQLWIQEEYVDGKKHGLCNKWNIDGNHISRKGYANGKKHGVHEIWYSNGQPKYRGEYVNGEEKGACKWWFSDGRPVSRGRIVNGLLWDLDDHTNVNNELIVHEDNEQTLLGGVLAVT